MDNFQRQVETILSSEVPDIERVQTLSPDFIERCSRFPNCKILLNMFNEYLAVVSAPEFVTTRFDTTVADNTVNIMLMLGSKETEMIARQLLQHLRFTEDL